MQPVQSDLLFDFDSATLNNAGKEQLDRLIEDAKELVFESLTLTGFTDQIGSDSYNQTLSENRARAVRNYLQAHGFPNKPINIVGKGAQEPVKALAECPAGPSQIACLAPNRRVVFTYMGMP